MRRGHTAARRTPEPPRPGRKRAAAGGRGVSNTAARRAVPQSVVERSQAARIRELEAERARMAAVLDAVREPVACVDRQWCFTFVNASAAALLGQTPEALFGRNVWEAVPDLQPLVREAHERVMTSREPMQIEALQRSTGRWYEARILPSPEGLMTFFTDISERKRNEALLGESERERLLLAELMPGVVFATDACGRNTYVNQQFADFAGLPVADLLGDGWMRVLHPDDRERAGPIWQRALAQQRAYDAEYRMRRYDGAYRWFLCRGLPWRDATGRIVGWYGSAVDIHDQKQAQLVLRAFTDRSHDMFALSEGDTGRFLYCNATFAGSMGYTSDEMLQLTVGDVEPGRTARSLDACTRNMPDGTNVPVYETRLVRKDGTSIEAEMSVTVLEHEGRRYIGALMRDLTERNRTTRALRESNRRLVLLAHASQTLILAGPPDHALLWQLFRQIGELLAMPMFLHYRPSQARQGLELVLAGGVDPHARETLASVTLGQTPCCTVAQTLQPQLLPDLAQTDESGVLRQLGARSYAGFPLVAHGRLLGTLAFVSRARAQLDDSDIATIRTLCDQIAMTLERGELMRELCASDRRKDDFLAMLSHELRNPLAPIRNASRALGIPTLSAEQSNWARGVIHRQVDHLSRLLDDLLDVSRITRGKLELRRAPVPVSAVLDSALEASRPLIDARRHRFELKVADRLPELFADPVRLAQVLSNLLNNAARYTPDGGSIVLRVRAEGATLQIDVEDNGIGIPPDARQRVFEMFSQLRGERARGDGGLGIGLALVKGIVELHGGSVSVHPAAGGSGSRFEVRLPLRPAQAAAPAAADAPLAPLVTRALRVLVVDDNHDAADSLAMLLRLSNHDVHVAYGGRAALELARTVHPEVALLDLGMPEVDGYALATMLRNEPWTARLSLVAITGWGQARDKERTAAVGFDEHLTKPVDLDTLQTVLRAAAAGAHVRERTGSGY